VPLALALLVLVAAQFLDYLTFVVMIAAHGLEAELNPLIVTLFEHLGLWGVTLAKASGVLLVVSAAIIIFRSRRQLAGVVVGFGIAAGLLGAFSNGLTI
jgi:Na+-transporting NADH:ubiquinone oxidoreductase subunit NqrE